MCGLGASSSAASGPSIAAAAVAAAGSGRSASPDDDDSACLLLLLPLPLLLFLSFADFFLLFLELPPLVVEVLRPSLRVPLLLFLPLLLRDGDAEAVLAGADSGAACADACWAAVASSSPPIPDEASGSGFSHPNPRGIMEWR